MSTDIKDWSFKLEKLDSGEKIILLSETSEWLDDRLGDHNLPKNIQSAVSSVLTLSGCIEEAVWEIETDESLKKMSKKLKALGFTERKD